MDVYKITLTPQSPFLIGGHRVLNNHYDTLDHIPAANVQAAIARRILESHGGYDVIERTRSGQPRYYIDDSVPLEGCEEQWGHWLQLFSDLQLTDATPFGADHYAPTTMGCKIYPDHPKVDLLQSLYNNRNEMRHMASFRCTCGARLERKSGWRWPEGKRLYLRTVTRVGLDDRRHVGADGQLFSMTVAEPYASRDRVPLQFIAHVIVPKSIASGRQLDVHNETIRVGKNLTVGLGKMRMDVERIEREPFPDERIRAWQQQVGDTSIPLLITSHLPFPFEDGEPEQYDDLAYYHEQFTNWLRTYANAPEAISVVFAYTQQTVRRNFRPGQMERHEELHRLLMPGSLLVVDSTDEIALKQWLHELHMQGIHMKPHTSMVRIAPEFCIEGGSK